jgi:hypothetical protein
MKMTFQEIRIIATAPCIANQLRDVNTICRRSWYIAGKCKKKNPYIINQNHIFSKNIVKSFLDRFLTNAGWETYVINNVLCTPENSKTTPL